MPDFNNLPLEVIATIFDHVDKPTLLASRLVCSDWKYVLDNFFFKAKVLLTNQSMRSVRYSELNIETLQVRNFTRDLKRFKKGKAGKSFSDNRLQVNPKKLVFMRKATKNLTHASVTSENMVKLLQLNNCIEYLFFDFNSLAFAHLAGIEMSQYQFLKQLKLCINATADERENLAHLAKVRFPLLSTLQIFGRFQATAQESAQVYLSFYQIVANHRSTLQVVNLVHPICSQRRGPNYAQPVLPISEPELDLLHQHLSQVQLTGIYINLDQNEGTVHRFDLGFRLLQNQENLFNLHVAFRENSQVSLCQIREVIERSAETLRCIDLIAAKRGNPLVNLPNVGAIDVLGLCSNLTTLRLVNFKIPRFSNSFIFNLPRSLVTLLCWGQLGGIEILEKVETLPCLERLDFYDTDGNPVGNAVLEQQLTRIILGKAGNPRITNIYWHKKNFNVNFLKELEGVVMQPFAISTAWSWPLKKTVLTDAFRITNTRNASASANANANAIRQEVRSTSEASQR